ncbi:hypothetical protein [Xenorhabdus bovienii]|uniref:hypothetical protein n=1 Tax=Xenorhabdus bovienii TaxID=40576 RepID=UPI0023B2605F|nr:hypothetical protein [Xenorhabdus bovienii]MDE9541064.1 hypothetical protein [Xenorhabdus bovienii]
MDILQVNTSNVTHGKINIAGFKHALTIIVAAAIGINRKVRIDNVPDVLDTHVLSKIINLLGGNCVYNGTALEIESSHLSDSVIPDSLAALAHGSIYLIPVLLGRFGRVKFSSFGGCLIGDNNSRPINHILSVLQKFGADFNVAMDYTEVRTKELHCCNIDIMDYSDVKGDLTGPLVSGATKTAILAAIFVRRGVTVIKNPYLKPDVTELLDFLKEAGHVVTVNTSEVIISHVACDEHYDKPVQFDLISDLSEIITYLTISVLSEKKIELLCHKKSKIMSGLAPEISLLSAMGVKIYFSGNTLSVSVDSRLRHADVIVKSTGIYSDHQPFFALMMCYATDKSLIEEKVWLGRFSYCSELNKLGANIVREGNKIYITPSQLHAEPMSVNAGDLRAAAVLLLAAIVRKGKTLIYGASHLSRGYNNLIPNLKSLSVDVHEINITAENEEKLINDNEFFRLSN